MEASAVLGPIRGYYIATYACPVGEHGREFLGCYKIFERFPSEFFETGHISCGSTRARYSSKDVALHHAALSARNEINVLEVARV